MTNMIGTDYSAGTNYGGAKSSSVGEKDRTEGTFSDTMAEKFCPSTKDMSLTEYKLYFHDRVKDLYTHPSQKNVDWLIDITDEAYLRMQSDPAYEAQVLDYLARNKAANMSGHAPKFIYIRIEDTMEKCHGYAFGIQEDSRARRAAERRRMAAEQARKARRKKLLKEYLKKRAQAKLLQDKFLKSQQTKRWLEHNRLAREWKEGKHTRQVLDEHAAAKKQKEKQAAGEWAGERQAAQASHAYEASLVMLQRYEEQLFS